MSEELVRRSRGLLACVLVAATGVLVGCTDSSANKTAPAAMPSLTRPAITPDMPKYIQAADTANLDSEGSVVSAGARSTVAVQDSKLLATAIRDENSADWPAGNYRLTVICAGTGALHARFELDATAKSAELPPCAPTATTGTVDLHLAAPARNSAVTITPDEGAQLAVAYRIQRM